MIYKCKHFKIEELVPDEVFQAQKDAQWKLWMIFDPELLRICDALRKRYGVAYVNNDRLQFRGYRPPSYYAKNPWSSSQHRFGRAVDMNFKVQAADEVRDNIRDLSPKQRDKYGFGGIRRIEDGVSWLHVDTGNWMPDDGQILFFNP